MKQFVTITGKKQITIPASIFKRMNLAIGDRLTVSIENDNIVMKKHHAILDELSGSLPPLPQKYKRMSISKLIAIAKTSYIKRLHRKR